MTGVLLDTGPLVAYCVAGESHHRWAVAQFEAARPPLMTCEPVLTEAIYLLGERGVGPEVIWEAMRRGVLKVTFDLESDFESVAVLMERYRDVPMDLADACLVRMSELHADSRIMTLDSDFQFYRRLGRQSIPLIAPF